MLTLKNYFVRKAVFKTTMATGTALKLFSKFKLGPFALKNRIVLAPMTRGRSTEQHVPKPYMATYYSQRADAGLIITEATGISRQGLGWYRAPGIWNDEQITAWKDIVSAVHAKNGVFVLQLWHMGRQAHSDVTGQPIISASNIGLEGEVTTSRGIKKPYETPKSPTEKEISSIITDYANGAVNAVKKAGFDAVEIHAANGYLIDQFLQTITNKREDKYGGSIENRLLFMKEVVNKIIDSGVDGNKIGIRLSPNGAFGGMGGEDNLELFTAAIEWLTNKNLLYIHVMDGLGFGYHEKCPPMTIQMAKEIINEQNKKKDKNDKDYVETALMGNVGYTKESAEEVVSKEYVDLIAFGRPYISNPDLVYRWENGLELNPDAEYPDWWGWDKEEDGYIDFPMVRPQ